MNSIEEKIWNYIDGTCSLEEQAAIEQLIKSDDNYRLKYEELMALNTTFANIEMDEPSMGFTYKVMEAVRAETALVPLHAVINKNIIRGLVAVFACLIASLLVYAGITTNWHPGNTFFDFSSVHLPVIKLPALKSGTPGIMWKIFICFDVVLALFFADTYLRRQRNTKAVKL